MSKDQWLRDHERIVEDFCSGEIDEDAARSALKALGFDPHEIDDQIAVLKRDIE